MKNVVKENYRTSSYYIFSRTLRTFEVIDCPFDAFERNKKQLEVKDSAKYDGIAQQFLIFD